MFWQQLAENDATGHHDFRRKNGLRCEDWRDFPRGLPGGLPSGVVAAILVYTATATTVG